MLRSLALRLLAFCLLAQVVSAGCSSSKAPAAGPAAVEEPEVRTSFDPSARFPAAAYCAWDTGFPKLPDDIRVDPLVLETRLREAISRELTAKNYRFRGYSPDYRVGYRVAITTDEFAGAPSERYTVKDGWIPAMAGARVVERGALVIELVDVQSRRLVWQGICEANVTMTADEQTRHDRLNRAVQALLADFPPNRAASSPASSQPATGDR
jgi:hypothetical protein